MGIFSWHKEKEELALVFDVGSSSVGGAFVLAQKSGIPKIIFSVRELISLQETLNPEKFLSATIKSLEIVASKIYKAGLGAPKAVFCVLSSPWHSSQTRVIRLEKNTSFVFTSKLAESLIQKEISLFEEEYLAKYRDAQSPVRSIEFKNIKTVLNGYETSNPLNQKVKELEMTVFISVSPEQVLKKIEETIMHFFHFKEIEFSSFVLASFAVVRNLYTNQDNFILIDVGGEVTDIAMIKKNILRESISFPLGSNFIVRRVASLLHSSFNEAKSIVSLLKDGHATESEAKKVGLIIDELKTEWLSKFQASLANLSNDISIPSTIFVSVEKDLADFFCEIIGTEQFNQYTLTESKFKIVLLSAEVFHGLIQFGENAIRDASLIVGSIYINRFVINSAKAEQA